MYGHIHRWGIPVVSNAYSNASLEGKPTLSGATRAHPEVHAGAGNLEVPEKFMNHGPPWMMNWMMNGWLIHECCVAVLMGLW